MKLAIGGGDRLFRKNPEMREFRTMALDEVKALRCGERVWFKANDGTARQVKVNGKPKRWKRRPDKVEIPVKYGLYEYVTFTYPGENRLLVLQDDTLLALADAEAASEELEERRD